MHRFKCALAALLTFYSLSAAAQSPRATKPLEQPLRFHLGVGYVQFGEPMTISEGSSISRGHANYAGPTFALELSKFLRRSQFGGVLSLGSGKAAAGSFDGDLTFDDAVNRGWWAAQLHPFINYRLSRDFLFGAGPLFKLRFVNWDPASTTLNVQTTSAYAFGVQLNLRIVFYDRLSLIQSYAILDAKGHNQWLFIAQYRL